MVALGQAKTHNNKQTITLIEETLRVVTYLIVTDGAFRQIISYVEIPHDLVEVSHLIGPVLEVAGCRQRDQTHQEVAHRGLLELAVVAEKNGLKMETIQ